jgi:hypothetical protein
MPDPHFDKPRNGFVQLAREMTETKERAVAWGFRGLLSVLMIALGIIGYLIQDKLGDFTHKFLAIDQQRVEMWSAFSKLANSQADQTNALTKLDTTVKDYVANQDRLIQDHEQRLRDLERPTPHHQP